MEAIMDFCYFIHFYQEYIKTKNIPLQTSLAQGF
jgi:hypothetical protein